eukprot:TRINITY_DN8852_c0_g1_i1.p1 TRINITY_DN8852_c0_g1~~TRINITY_DN8852_c0_g1_i1.p1  ORF type:complete len:1269 (+),score=263.71 TRINITY_DN8852_c0_g1_i1:62-3868(+)
MGEPVAYLHLPRALEEKIVASLITREEKRPILTGHVQQTTRKNSQFRKVNRLVEELLSLGFKEDHIALLLERSTGSSLHQAVDWLSLHLRDDQLPDGYVPKRSNYDANTSNYRIRVEKDYETLIALSEKKYFSESSPMASTSGPSAHSSLTSKKENVPDEDMQVEDLDQDFAGADFAKKYPKKSSAVPPETKKREKSTPDPEVSKPSTKSKQLEPDKKAALEKEKDAKGPKSKQVAKEPEKPLKTVGGKKVEPVAPTPADPKKKGGKTDAVPVPAAKSGKDSLQKAPEALPEKKEQKIVWTGKLPKTYLHEWCQRNKLSKPRFDQMPCKGGQFKFQVVIEDKKKGDKIFKIDQAFPSVQEAQHAASTRALFELSEGQSLYRLFPSPFKDMWLEWETEKKKALEDMKKAGQNQRREFVTQFLSPKTTQSPFAPQNTTDANPPASSSETSSPQMLAKRDQRDEDVRFRFNSQDSTKLKEMAAKSMEIQEYKDKVAARMTLPAFSVRQQLLKMMGVHQVMIISGDTGCGKTTQIPQYLLEDMIEQGKGGECNIICTQPRRISAVSVASRVADERCEKLGARSSLCGYQVRMESRRSADTRLLFCTTGILLRILQGNPNLKGVSHVVVDEVHERSVESDLLLLLLLLLLKKGSSLKVILMSATVNAESFAAYFSAFNPGLLNIPGRTHPVTRYFLEDIVTKIGYTASTVPQAYETEFEAQYQTTSKGVEEQKVSYDKLIGLDSRAVDILKECDDGYVSYDLVESILRYIHTSKPEGAVLVFLPGFSEIQGLYEHLNSTQYSSQLWIRPLHSQLSTSDQQLVFQKPPAGQRKVILSTNICETSVTIEDICYVIDTGKVRQSGYSPGSRMQVLSDVWAAKSNIQQRAGRAGRVRAGECYFLFSKPRYELFDSFPVPEIRRSCLDELILLIKSMNVPGSVSEILAQALDPPCGGAVDTSLKNLREVGAIFVDDDGVEAITELGLHLAKLPVDVRVGKMMIYAAIFECIEPILYVAATLSLKSPFQVPFTRKEEAYRRHKRFHFGESDLLTFWNVVREYKDEKFLGKRSARSFCDSHYLNYMTLDQICDLADDFANTLMEIGFLPRCTGGRPDIDSSSRNANNLTIVRSIICAGLFPNIAFVSKLVDGTPTYMGDNDNFVLHPNSVNASIRDLPSSWITYHTKVKQRRITLRDSTFIQPMTIPLFANKLDVHYGKQVIVVNDWIKLGAPVRIAAIIRQIRRELDYILHERAENPTEPLCESSASIMQLLEQLLSLS